jgi:gliding motility-associated-like protein
MRHLIVFIFCLITSFCIAQNVQVDSQSFTPQQLIEDILIDSDCIDNVVVTNVVGGDFGNTDQSYGYFDATGTTFPFERGIVMSTGRLNNVGGPNTSLSDDDANNWVGDTDLENILNETNTLNATIIEFEFTAIANEISFRYIFASEEYQEGNANTCQYSDLFGFLIRPQNSQQYDNIALVPNTQTPVKVTTVHSGIPGACSPINEAYFGSWNNSNAPINFNGQTAILTATAQVIPNDTYHVKLVIADEFNYRYDSAVFLEAGSFQLSSNLGPDRLVATNNPVCENDTLALNAFNPNANTYKWFKDGNELTSETNAIYTVTENGTYNVEVTLDDGCISFGEITIEYTTNPVAFDTVINECDNNQDLITAFNLWDAVQAVTNNDPDLQVSGFYLSFADAQQSNNSIANPNTYQNITQNQIVYARVENYFSCATITEVQLSASYNPIDLDAFTTCEDDTFDGISTFNLNELQTAIEAQLFIQNPTFVFYETLNDVSNDITISGNYTNTTPDLQTIYVKILVNGQCYSLTTVDLQVLPRPMLEADITASNPIYYCLNSSPDTITLYGGVINDLPNNYYYLWNTGATTSSIHINQPGTYDVTVTHPNGCSSLRSIVVAPSNIATIDNVIVEDLSNNNNVTIITSGEGDYEYALNDSNGPYQDSNYFENIPSGFHTVYVRDKIGCGIVEQVISVRGFPKYFTPNADDIHDTWHVNGINNVFHQGTIVQIFNRYGKHITTLNNYAVGWDGTLNGSALASDDYWFVATFSNGKMYKGHFSLRR